MPNVQLLLVLLAAAPFADTAKKFPSATLPLDLKDPPALTVKLSAKDVKALGLDGDALLSDWTKKPEKNEKKALLAHARIVRAGHQLLLLRFEDALGQNVRAQTYLYSFNDKGQLLGSYLFHEQATLDGVKTTNVSTLTAAGALARVTKAVHPMTEEGLPGDCIVTSEERGKVTSTGGIELLPPFWSARSGEYVERRSGATMRVFEKRVFFKGENDDGFTELLGDGNSMRMPDAGTPWAFTWNERRSEVSALSPAGNQVMFVRRW